MTLSLQGRGTGGGCMVRMKPEPSTQGNQGASTLLLNKHHYILTSKFMNPTPLNLDPNSQDIKLNIQRHKPTNTKPRYPAPAGEDNVRTPPLSTLNPYSKIEPQTPNSKTQAPTPNFDQILQQGTTTSERYSSKPTSPKPSTLDPKL